MVNKYRSLSIALLAALVVPTCAPVPLTGPPGTTLFVQANPPFVIANGGHSVVTVFLTEPAGTLVSNGVEVFCFTDLGRIDERVKTKDGIARANFVADSRSGIANVRVWSGGPAPAPSASASPSATTTSSATGTGSASIQIAIGSALPKKIVVTANPAVLASSRQAQITASVFDSRGNPVQNVAVIFAVSGSPLQETLESGSTPQYTDSNGQAFDVLRTRAPNGTTQKTVKVTATTPGGDGASSVSDEVSVPVNYDPTI